MKNTTLKGNKGDIIVSVIVFSAVALVIITGLTSWGSTMLAYVRNTAQREQAFQIAEAGVDYYQWHLAQYPNDYTDGTNTSGPYVHNFYDKNGNILGNYSLTITPPALGSTIVKIVSKGTLASSTISKTVQKNLAIPSLAKYAVVANDDMRFGEGTEIFGKIHSNRGIRFDGIAHNLVSSALSTYTDPDSNLNQWAVYTTAGTDDPRPPTSLPLRTDVFMAGRQLPVPSIDFPGFTIGLTKLQALAQASAGGKEWTSSGKQGYHIVFKVSNGTTTYDIYRVNNLQTVDTSCSGNSTSKTQVNGPKYYQWGTWSIQTPISSNQTFIGNYPIPSNGVIFVDDHVWVDGTISNARVTVVAGIIGNTDPLKNANITVNTNLKYTNYDGSDSMGLIAQGNVNVGMLSDDNLRIDAALVAEKGRVGRFYYGSSCPSYNRNSLTLYGMIATNVRYGFAYSDGTGYDIRNITYDGNLLYSPPPHFPQATSQYEVISWKQSD
jgi:hypothetical protein